LTNKEFFYHYGVKLLSKSKSAILLLFFNRPDLARISLCNLTASERDVYISIDGPRNAFDYPGVQECISLAEAYAASYSKLSKVKLLTRDSNLGCKEAVRTAIDWAFETEERLIVLEDDISFNNEFLQTMDNWLQKFDATKEVFHLNGYTPLPKRMEVDFTYLSRYTHVWGWATWRDRWNFYDRDLETWDGTDLRLLPGLLGQDLSDNFCEYWNRQLLACSEGLDTWDIQWLYSQWRYGGYSLTPGSRLTGNMGFDDRATHTKRSGNRNRRRQPALHFGKFLDPTEPKFSLKLNLIHDQTEFGIIGGKEFLSSPAWILKTGLARGYLYLLRFESFHQFAAKFLGKLMSIFSGIKTLLDFVPEEIIITSKIVLTRSQKAKRHFMRIGKFCKRAYKFLSWRVFRR